MSNRSKLLKISPNQEEFQNFVNRLDTDYKDILLLVGEQEDGKFTIFYVYDVHEKYFDDKGFCFKALENVISYKYSNRIMLVNIDTSSADAKQGYWMVLPIDHLYYESFDNKSFDFDPYLKVEYVGDAPDAVFVEAFDYLTTTSRMVNIAGNNYIVGYGYFKEMNNVLPMFASFFLETDSTGIQTIYETSDGLNRFGPFHSIVPFKDGEYPYVAECYHGYWGKNADGNIVSMISLVDETYSTKSIKEHYPYLYWQGTRYTYDKLFNKPLQSVSFLKRDLENFDWVNKKHCARDIWKLVYADGSKAVMFNTIGEEDCMFPIRFHYFIITEAEAKEYFS